MTAIPLGLRVLMLLDFEEHKALTYDQIATHLNEPPDEVRAALSRLRGVGLVQTLAVAELEAHGPQSAARWRLNEAGREEAARIITTWLAGSSRRASEERWPRTTDE